MALSVLVVPSWYPSIDDPTAGLFVKYQVEALRDSGISVAVLIEEHSDKRYQNLAVEQGIPTVRFSMGAASGSPVFSRMRLGSAYLQSILGIPNAPTMNALARLEGIGFKPDVIHVHALWPAMMLAASIARKIGIPILVTEHSEEYSVGTERKLVRTPGMLPLVLRPLARKASAYVAPSEKAARRLEELRLADSVAVVPNAIPYREPQDSADSPRKRIVHASHLGHAKNLPLLFRAIAKLSQRRDDFVVDVIGDGRNRPAVEAGIAKLNIDDRVVLHGRATSEELNASLDRAAFGVLSSDHETFSVFAAECLMAGRPVVTTRSGGPEEFVGAGQGRLVEVGDSDGLVDALDWMLDHYRQYDPVVLNTYATSRFSQQAVAEELRALYQSVLAGSR